MLCLTSWRDVLDLLKQVNLKDGRRSDILQLDGRAKFGELDGFPPMRGQELSDVSVENVEEINGAEREQAEAPRTPGGSIVSRTAVPVSERSAAPSLSALNEG